MMRLALTGCCAAINRSAIAALALLASAITAQAQLPNAQLNTIFPPGGKQGATVDVTALGKDLDGATRLLFSHPGIVGTAKMVAPNEFLPPRPSSSQFAVTIAADVPPGVYDVRVVGKYGASNPRSFVVGAHAESLEKEPNNDVATAMPIAKDSAVFANTDNEAFDYYKLALKKGEKIVIDCLGHRIDSKVDLTLVVLDAAGNELVQCRDVERRDPITDFAAPADGDYFLKIYDHTYRGGDEFAYRLSVSTAPHIDFTFPPCGEPGAKTRVTLYGRNLPGGTPAPGVTLGGRPLEQLAVDIDIPGDAAARQSLAATGLVESDESGTDGFAYRLPGPGGLSNPTTIGFASAPVVVEQEPNNDAGHAQHVNLPCEIVGQFYPRSDADWFTFDAKKGESYWIDVLAQRLGTSADPYMLIERVTKNDKGEEQTSMVAEVDDDAALRRNRRERRRDDSEGRRFSTRTGDIAYEFEVPADGTYRVLIRDLYYRSRGNPQFVYRLAIRKAQEDFRLVVTPLPDEPQQDQSAVPIATALLRKGGNVALEVYALRRDGCDDEIDVTVAGLPPGVTAAPAKIGEGDATGIVTLIAEPGAADWVGELTITGKATIAGADVVRTARAGAVVAPAQNGNERAHSRVARSIVLSVSGSEGGVAAIRAGDGKTWEMSRGGKLQIPIQVARMGDFKGAIALQAKGLPQQLGNPSVNIAADQSAGNLELTLNPQTPPGLYSFHLQGQTQLAGYRRNPEAAQAAQNDKQELEKIATQLNAAQQQAQQAKQTAEQMATAATSAAKQAADAATAAEKQMQSAQQQAAATIAAAAAAKTAAAAKADDANLATAAANAQKAADEAAAKLKIAADVKNAATQAVTAASAKAQQMTDAKTAADKAHNEAVEKTKRAEQAKQALTQLANQATQAANAKNVNVLLYSTPIAIRVTPGPVRAILPAGSLTVDQGGQTELKIALARLYGYNDEFEIDLARDNARGVDSQSVKVPAGATEATLIVRASKDAAPGERQFNVELRTKFNGQSIQAREPLTIVVNKKAK
jgi:hypothetical protein